MNIAQMRRADAYLGGCLCLCLTFYCCCRKLFCRHAPHPVVRPERVLVTKYLGMGSILLITPAVRALRREYPDCRIELLTLDQNAEFAADLGLFDRVISLRSSHALLFALDVLRAVWSGRRVCYDVAFDFEFFARFSTIMSYLIGARTRVGYYLPKLWRGGLLTHQIHFNPYKHATEIFAAQLSVLGVHVLDYELSAPAVDAQSAACADSFLKSHGITPDQKLVLVNPNAGELCRERRWPPACFAELIARMVERNAGLRVILVGAPVDREVVREVYDLLPEEARKRTVSSAGVLGIRALIALINRCTLFVSNDSGPLHLAVAAKVPTVSFFGPESPALYGPRDDRHTVFFADIYCSPCLNVYNSKRAMCAGDNRCMQEIKAADVIKKLERSGVI